MVDLESIDPARIRIVRVDRASFVSANVIRNHQRNVLIQPRHKLRKGVTYRVVVTGVRDELGNLGPRVQWQFTTEPPPPPPPKKDKKKKDRDKN